MIVVGQTLNANKPNVIISTCMMILIGHVGARVPDPLLDVSRARVSLDADGAVSFDDPEAPFTARLWVTHGIHPLVRRIVVESRNGVDITAARLCRLPVAQMRYVAAVETTRSGGPNEQLYGMLATPRPPAGWGDDHWERVMDVWQRGEEQAGRGGGVRAVARLWGVTVKPTAYRWAAEARRRAGSASP